MNEQHAAPLEEEGDIGQMCRRILTEYGVTPMMRTVECVMHKSRHENCSSCKHDLGCRKLTALLRIGLLVSQARPSSLRERLGIQTEASEIMELIAKAETNEEVSALSGGRT